MSRRAERAAIQTVAKRFSATVARGADLADAVVTIGGRTVALDVMTLRSRAPGRTGVIKPRLRFDKVALGLVARLRTALQGLVPDGRTIVVTVTAPIRVRAKTAAAIEGEVHRLLANRARPARLRAMIHRNQVQVRIVPGGTRRTSKVIGFVHNPDSEPSVLIELTRRLLACLGSGRRPCSESAGERGLIVADEKGLLPLETYRSVCSQLGILPSGRIESLQ